MHRAFHGISYLLFLIVFHNLVCIEKKIPNFLAKIPLAIPGILNYSLIPYEAALYSEG